MSVPPKSSVASAETRNPEVAAHTTRRHFTAAAKARILAEYEKGNSVQRAALCRREKIYSSHIAAWRKQRDAGGPLEQKRGRKPDPQGREVARLRQEKATLEKRLAKAEQVIEVQGKVYALLRAVAGESAEPKDEAPWTKR